MLNYDFSPFYRSTIGFDRLLSMLDKHAGPDSNGQSYPPYNIERTGENAYRITLAVAGFSNAELSVETRENTLTVRGSKEAVEKGEGDKREVLYQGIAARAFERRFHLADHVSATGATTRMASCTSSSCARCPRRRSRVRSRSRAPARRSTLRRMAGKPPEVILARLRSGESLGRAPPSGALFRRAERSRRRRRKAGMPSIVVAFARMKHVYEARTRS